MKKISKIRIHNFQSHEDTEVELSHGMNVFYGQSDNGKSSIIRALSSVLFRDKFYMRSGENRGEVSITIDSHTLSRHKSIKGTNISEKFVLDSVAFRKIGKKLPDEILNATKMKPIELTDGSLVNLNLQTQHEGKFLLSDNYGDGFRARITSLAASEALDRASMEAAKEHREAKSELNYEADKRLHETEERISKYKDLESHLEFFKSINNKYKELQRLETKIRDLRQVNFALKGAKKINDYRGAIRSLIDHCNSNLVRLSILFCLYKAKEVTNTKILPTLPSLDLIHKSIDRLRLYTSLWSKNGEVARCVYNIKDLGHERNDCEEMLTDFMNEIKVCPLCQNEL